jgi:uncharacterized protein YdeI (YjbR/CyaY-like superfamily)
MPAKKLKTLDVPTATAWRTWLDKHHASESEIWLVFHKQHTGRRTIAFEDAVDEALCYGWIDSLIRRLDDVRYARKFTPRKLDSRWSTTNRRRYAKLKAAGRLKKPGLVRPPTNKSGDAPMVTKIPKYIEQAIKKNRAAWTFFQNLAPGYRRQYVIWTDSAKLEATKQKRLAEVVRRLAAGHKPGMV